MAQDHIIDGNLITDGRPLAVEVQNDVLAVDGPLTDAELRATPPAVGIYGANSAGVLAALRRDPTTNAFKTIDYPHAEIHGGNAFNVWTYDADLDTADELIIAFYAPNTAKWPHPVFLVANTATSLFEIMRAPTITADTGSDLVVFNLDENSATTSGIQSIKAVPVANQATLNPTITNDGTVIWGETLGGNKNQGASLGVGGRFERKLRQGAIYAARLTGIADNGVASIAIVWYEHTDIA